MPRTEHGYLSIREFSDYLNVTPRTVQNMLRRGELRGAIRIGSGRGSIVRIPVSALADLHPYHPQGDSSDGQE